MKILIDADGCPVVKQTIDIAKEKQIEVVVFCDTSHVINSDYAKTVTVSKGADSVDFALVNQVSRGDIVVTQDYGLSAMVLVVVTGSLIFARHPAIQSIGIISVIGMSASILLSYSIEPFLFRLMMKIPYYRRRFGDKQDVPQV